MLFCFSLPVSSWRGLSIFTVSHVRVQDLVFTAMVHVSLVLLFVRCLLLLNVFLLISLSVCRRWVMSHVDLRFRWLRWWRCFLTLDGLGVVNILSCGGGDAQSNGRD